MSTDTKDIFQTVTDQIVAAIENGAGTYKLPWRTSSKFLSSPINAVSKRPYRGVNILVLWATAEEKRYTSGTWATFKQWKELGAQVRKGEKSAHVVFWKFLDKNGETEQPAGEAKENRIPMAKHYWLFNADQVDGYQQVEEPPLSHSERIERAEEFFQSLGVAPKPGGNNAFYDCENDSVHMPAFDAFKEPLFYYSVLSHESTHWTAAPHRVNRDLKGKFGSEAYAMEELVAELGAAFLCAQLGLPTDPRQDHAPYIASWLKVLKNDKRAIFTAAAKAQEAMDWMIKKTGQELKEAA